MFESANIDNLVVSVSRKFWSDILGQYLVAGLTALFWDRDSLQRFTPFCTSTNLIVFHSSMSCGLGLIERIEDVHFRPYLFLGLPHRDSFMAIMRSLNPSFLGTEDQAMVIAPPDEIVIFMISEVPPVMVMAPKHRVSMTHVRWIGNGNLSLVPPQSPWVALVPGYGQI